MAVKARYKGRVDANGVPQEFYNGIPARDLSDDEYAALDGDQKRLVRYGDLYAMADDKPASKAKRTEAKAAEAPADNVGAMDSGAEPLPTPNEGSGS